MNRKKAVKEIRYVMKYSDRVYGSCTHSYMGCMADAGLQKILGNHDGYGNGPGFDVLFETATDEQIAEGREYVEHWFPIAKRYFAPGSRIGRLREALS